MYYKNCFNKTNRIGKEFDLAFLFQRIINKNKTNTVLFLFLLFASNLSFSQLALQEFQSGIPASWAVQSNQTVSLQDVRMRSLITLLKVAETK